jgi:outer membrane protein OmpA-like peptidoglycan-associated protein
VLPLLSLLLPLTAQAQDATAFDGQLVRPSADSLTTIWLDDASIRPGFVGRLGLGYARDPVLVISDGSEEGEALIADLGELDIIAGWAGGPVRAALLVPLVGASSELADGAAGLGDLGVDVKGQLVDPDEFGFGLAVGGRVTAPTATAAETLPLGNAGVSWELRLIVDKPVGDLRLLANVGYTGRPAADLGDVVSGSALLARVGAGYAIGEGGVSAELGGAPILTALGGGTAFPVEGLAGGWLRAGEVLVVRGSAGTGLTKGIGAARARGLVTLEFNPREDKDPDGDGLVGKDDACPSTAEDFDGVEDGDGCPESATMVDLLVKDPYGGAITDAVVLLQNGEDLVRVSASERVILEPGSWRLTAEADEYLRLDDLFTVKPNEPLQVVKVMEPDYQPTGRVVVEQDRIAILEKIYFQTGSAELRTDSFGLLQEIAGTLRAHPDVRLVRVEGHTDSRGDAEFNLQLSQSRAEQVARFLTQHGVPADRLVAQGYGESRPVDERETEAGWDRNRRVEFVIVERD